MAFLGRYTRSIVIRLLLLATLLVVSATLIRFIFLMGVIRSDLIRTELLQQEALAKQVASNIEEKLLERKKFLGHLAETLPVELLQDEGKLKDWLSSRYDVYPVMNGGIFVTDLDGRVIADFPEQQGRKSMVYADRDYFQGALAGKFTVGKPVIGRALNEPALPMAAPVSDEHGQVKAVLVGVSKIYATGFLDVIQHGRIGDQGGYLLLSPAEQIYVAASKPELTLTTIAKTGAGSLYEKAMAGHLENGLAVNAEGVEELLAFATVSSTDWLVVARLPSSEALALIVNLKNHILRSSLLALIVILLMMYFSLAVFFRPLRRSAELANNMSNGDLPMQALPVVHDDEVGLLTKAFNRLMQKLLDSQSELAGMVRRDALTGLPNRLHLTEKIQEALARAKRKEGRVALLYLDLDGFKPVNDGFGHEAGDQALVDIANRLSAIVRQVDTLARVGGDEFVVLISGLSDDLDIAEAAVITISNKYIAALQEVLTVKGQPVQLGVSIGIALGDGDSTVESLMYAADNAMYAAKKAGRGRYALAEDNWRESC
ncbi:diguanylate cyclase [Undibacterium sp. TS12]|uniref:diguanylate cyclase domain-containing protein n=1 Tax=Undibacterium sp. TS12 TaxID=2908202 RepID=UPI001F4CA043|nr:diguanylate cyclase [Undibacterium sp. TS12]MCH8619758.1 diguanylate cyclase [Undibacterium sp. TS12]